jgi:ABC-type multidrug transport system ATPase subunit
MYSNYSENKKYFSSFWALYLVGINNLYDIKYTLTIFIIQIIIGMVATYFSNKLLMNDSINTTLLIYTIIICSCNRSIVKLSTVLLSGKANRERLMISERIASFVNKEFNNSSYKWRRENPDMTQREAIEMIFHTYCGITWNIGHIITSSIDTFTFIVIAFYNSLEFGILSIIGSYTLYIIRRKYNMTLEKKDLEMNSLSKKIKLDIANQYTFRADSLTNPLMVNLMKSDQNNPIIGHSNSILIWDDRNYLADSLKLINEVIKSLFIMSIAIYMIFNQKLVLWVLINGDKLFGIMNIISRLDDIQNLSSSRISTHIKNIDELVDSCKIDISINKNKTILNYIMSRPQTINIGTIHLKLNDMVLKSLTPIRIDLQKKGIILLNGPKGCGKSLTMDILAGQYDGSVCNGTMYINGKPALNEFRSTKLINSRIYIQQLVSDYYRQNKINTISMSLRELFPDLSYQEIYTYLQNFDMCKKMPNETRDALDIPLGKNERSFSPGELQAMILASQLHRAYSLNISLLLLDEPERNIDYETVQNIFDKVISKFEGTIIMITHNDTLKQYLKDSGLIKNVWQFESSGNNMSFRT